MDVKLNSVVLDSVIGLIHVNTEFISGNNFVKAESGSLYQLSLEFEEYIQDERTFWTKVKGLLFQRKHFTLKPFLMKIKLKGWLDKEGVSQVDVVSVSGDTKYMPIVLGYTFSAIRVNESHRVMDNETKPPKRPKIQHTPSTLGPPPKHGRKKR